MAEHWMEILRPGEWNDTNFSAAMLREIQASYDPVVREAPIIVGHPDPFSGEQPAYGWVYKLEIRKLADAETDDDISLWALTELSEEAEGFIREKKFPKRSVGLGRHEPFDGIWYLNHVALLGSSNPAATNMEEVKLKESFKAEDGVLVMLSVNDKMIELAWESKGKEYWYRTRPPNRFRSDTIRSIDFKGISGIRAVIGKLKEQFVPEGGKPDSMVIQALRFDKKNFDLAKAKAWVTSHKKELSRMSETITLDSQDELTQLKANYAKLEAQNVKATEDVQELKDAAKKAHDELEIIRLAKLEGEFEHELKSLIDDGNGVPAYIEAGVHKALVAVDGIEVTLADGSKKKASAVFLDTLKAMPKVLETKEVAGAGGGKEVKLSEGIPLDNRFGKAMEGYAAEGKKVVNAGLVELANKIEKEEGLSPKEAAVKAMTLAAQGGK